MLKRFLAVATIACLAAGSAAKQDAEMLPLDRALKKAQADGKYRMLLRQIRVDSDRRTFGAYHDFGFNSQAVCAEYTDLPRGHWVYVYPYWYIWRDRVTGQESKRPWGPEQAAGPADTAEPGDRQSAWASATQDGGDEWLMLEYAAPVRAYAVHIYETYNPGSVVRITGFTLDGSEVELWRRARPVIPSTPGFIFRPMFSRRITTMRLKLYLDSKRTPGWNEIDAVRLRDEMGGLQWAVAAHASSTYGVSEQSTDAREDRVRLLEEENRRLKLELEFLRRGTPAREKYRLPGDSVKPDAD